MSGPLSPGDIIGGRYTINRYVDAGGMQFVYEAIDNLTDRVVALKTPKNSSATKWSNECYRCGKSQPS